MSVDRELIDKLLFDYKGPEDVQIRKILYTTNAIESLNMSLRKAIKTRGAFPTEEAALKVMYLALKNLARKWHPLQGWNDALNCFALLWEAPFPQQGG